MGRYHASPQRNCGALLNTAPWYVYSDPDFRTSKKRNLQGVRGGAFQGKNSLGRKIDRETGESVCYVGAAFF